MRLSDKTLKSWHVFTLCGPTCSPTLRSIGLHTSATTLRLCPQIRKQIYNSFCFVPLNHITGTVSFCSSMTHHKFDVIGVRSHDLQFMDSTFHLPETAVLTTEPYASRCIIENKVRVSVFSLVLYMSSWHPTSCTVKHSWPVHKLYILQVSKTFGWWLRVCVHWLCYIVHCCWVLHM